MAELDPNLGSPTVDPVAAELIAEQAGTTLSGPQPAPSPVPPGVPPSTPPPPPPTPSVAAEFLALRNAEVALLKEQLAAAEAARAEAEQRAALPPLAGNPGPGVGPALTGYELISQAIANGGK